MPSLFSSLQSNNKNQSQAAACPVKLNQVPNKLNHPDLESHVTDPSSTESLRERLKRDPWLVSFIITISCMVVMTVFTLVAVQLTSDDPRFWTQTYPIDEVVFLDNTDDLGNVVSVPFAIDVKLKEVQSF